MISYRWYRGEAKFVCCHKTSGMYGKIFDTDLEIFDKQVPSMKSLGRCVCENIECLNYFEDSDETNMYYVTRTMAPNNFR
jgi:hypothetical protein